ncbi:hypothetical protein F0562_018858 [Nyssa sinensis]|uniref:Stigma-specific STIG1-like protein 1 n=1 Tax=Nyssa sinensis TaxID=561372 RepID=A0A5J4ZE01_9ASTE|nr:hypothetical protein F0562_018858 [Nyssa sinensis]
MKCLKIFLIVTMLMALVITISATTDEEDMPFDDDEEIGTDASDIPLPESQQPTSLRGTGRFLAQKPRVTMTCNNYPKICRVKGSLGRDCCNKKCVNLKTDRLNCGKCGKKCKYSEICCKGKCLNPLSDKKNCGSCNNKCKKGTKYEEEMPFDDDEETGTEASDIPLPESQQPTSLRGTGRFLAQRSRVTMTCNNYPKICRVKGSPGRNCCNKKCVNLKTDRLNCGKCGKKCKYSDICCKGKCVNPLSDKKHCGSCNNKCKKGTKCIYGMCNYA